MTIRILILAKTVDFVKIRKFLINMMTISMTTNIRAMTIVSAMTIPQTRFVTHKLVLFLLFFGFFNIVNAQCDFDINFETTNSTCPANGSIKVTLSGNKIDLSNVFISITNGATINEQTSANGHTFGSLPPGEYSITAQSVLTGTQTTVTCYDATTITSEYTPLIAIITDDKRSSLNCLNSGIININARNGRLPYKIKIISKPEGYTGETSFTTTSSGLITFKSGIAPGDYIFEVSDACGYTRSLNVTIDKLDNDFPSTPFYNALYYSSTSGCKSASLNENSGGSNIYWDSYRIEFYEIAFTFDDSEVKNYTSVNKSSTQSFELPETYTKMHADGKKMKVYIRLKGTECERLVGEFQFSKPPQTSIKRGSPDKYCNNYKAYFYLENDRILCYPYKWEIFDETDVLVANAENIYNFGSSYYQSVGNLSYNTNYTLKVTDANGTELFTTLSYTKNPSSLAWNGTSDDIYSYDLKYNVNNICMPYKWEVFDADSVFIKDMGGVTKSSGVIEDLEYDKEYIINMFDDSGNIISSHYKKVSPNRYINNIIFGGSSGGSWTCDTYNITIELTNITTPYTWYVMKNDVDSTVVSSGTNENNILSGLLIYDSAYIIKVTDGITTVYKNIDENSISYSGLYGPSWDKGDFDYQCNDYAFHFRLNNFYCFPYKWKLVDENNDSITGKENLNILDYDTVRLEYDKSYKVIVTDSKGREWEISSYLADNAVRPYINKRNEDQKCTDYKFSFEPYNVNCFPFKWEIFDSDNNLVADSTDLTKDKLGVTFSLRLETNKDYTVKITDAKDRKSSYSQRVNMGSTNFNFSQYSRISDCVDNSGYIRIYGGLDPATRVRFVSGPQTPVHTDTVLQAYTSNFYPFSQNYRYQESLSMTEGDYIFEITDKCGGIHQKNFTLKKSMKATEFSYTADEISGLCNSGEVRIYPRGKIHNNGNPVETWFSLIGTPDNPYHPSYSEKNISENDKLSYFSLTTKGKYVIGIRRTLVECVIDTIVIDHVPKEFFTLEGRSSYVCETGTIGHIRVQAINGKSPYLYTLYNQDRATLVEGIAPNDTGEFEYGAFGEKYAVKVQDACGISFWIDVEINTLDQTTLLSGKTDICKDGSIELNCLLLGMTEYRWSGPNDFSANTRTISIPNVTAVNSGEYIIEVKPAGCNDFFSRSINVTVHEVPLPDEFAPIDLCQADADHPLTIEPAAGYSIKWYDKDENPLSASIIDLRVSDDYIFNVKHVDNVFGCVSEKREVKAKVNPSPAKNAEATGWSCRDKNPKITVTDVVEGYVYTVFADAEATNPVMTFTGTADETMNLTLTATVRDDSTFYLQTATAAGCMLSPGIVEFQIEVDLLEILTDKLPVYFHEVPYSVQLTGNIENPVFTYTGSLVTGL
ncbi:MAG: carboxypeptidase-like regulatory domain-containing protein, partial [Prevotellaceae bacterium]|nr:carboxypeptidase-like regulatory domain-containing protein [Prevotellaceae bacterium]